VILHDRLDIPVRYVLLDRSCLYHSFRSLHGRSKAASVQYIPVLYAGSNPWRFAIHIRTPFIILPSLLFYVVFVFLLLLLLFKNFGL
jgi:hypothetical protein